MPKPDQEKLDETLKRMLGTPPKPHGDGKTQNRIGAVAKKKGPATKNGAPSD